MRYLLPAAIAAILVASPTPAVSHGAGPKGEMNTRIFERDLPNVPGKVLLAAEVDYPPGAASPSHTHPASAFIFAYVLSGEVESAVDDEKPRIYRAGESWYEAPGARHRVSRNASRTKPAKLLAIFVVDPGGSQLTFPDED